MAVLAFKFSTVALGAVSDSLGMCQPALLGVFLAVLLLFMRDKRQMARVAIWAIALSFIGTAIGAYGAFSVIRQAGTPKMAEFAAGLVILAAGLVEIYKHELLKINPIKNNTSEKVMLWARRAVLPMLAFVSSIMQVPCESGPYSLISEALLVRPGQMIEMYLLIYAVIMFIPFCLLLCLWYSVLSLPGSENFKNRHRTAIRILVGAAAASIGVYLLWNTHAVALLPGIANIGGRV